MTKPYYFETVKIECGNNPGRVGALSAKRQILNEACEQRDIEVKRRTAIQLRTTIAGFQREIANLDVSISSELELASVREPSHFAYPILARAMQARRENLKTAIATLSDRLASIAQPRAEPIPVLKLDGSHPVRTVAHFDSN
jgi:hypothetical protein